MSDFKSFADFTGVYSFTRTLSFQLNPVGKTDFYIQKRGLLTEDENRANDYKKVKKIIDEYHKMFIESVLSKEDLQNKIGEMLPAYEEIYLKNNRTEDEKKKMIEFQKKMREEISKAFKSDDRFAKINKKDLIQSDIDTLPLEDEKKKLVHSFNKWTAYFTGFNENRQNMYVKEAKSTAIGFRIVDQNLAKFIDNCKSYKKIIEKAPNIFDKVDGTLLTHCGIRSAADAFTIAFFRNVLSQNGIEKYNSLIGGYAIDDKKVQGLNELINLYCQKNKTKLPRFIPLFKQILSDRLQELNFLPPQFESDSELLATTKTVWDELQLTCKDTIPELLDLLKNGDLSRIYIPNDTALTGIMQEQYNDWSLFKNIWFDQYKDNHPKRASQSESNYEEKIEKEYKSHESFSLKEIQDVLNQNTAETTLAPVIDYFTGFSMAQLSKNAEAVQELLNTDYPEDKKLLQDADAVAALKAFLDSLKDVQRFLKKLTGSGKEAEKDTAFYQKLDNVLEQFDAVTLLYNKVRNYLTKKPYSLEKFKLNFDNEQLLNGWDQNKEKDYKSVLFRKNGDYYLGIIPKNAKVNFNDGADDGADGYEKMIYKFLPQPNKMIPKVFLSNLGIQRFDPPQNVVDAYQKHKNEGHPYTAKEIEDLIEYYKSGISRHEDWSVFQFKFTDASKSDLDKFYQEIEQRNYKISFKMISKSFIDGLVEEGNLYLFQIWNKDFSSYSKGTENMHTMYWKMVFDERNLADYIFKLNGQAEIFYRKKSITDNRVTHPANQPIKCRRDEKVTKTFEYDLIKDKRFRKNQYSFHVPIAINCKAGKDSEIDTNVREYLRTSDNYHIIGVDRGERNLVYISVIDRNGKIVEQRSLNAIVSSCNGQADLSTDYQKLLDSREKDNDKAQKSWQTVEKIKDLKAGYLSQVIHTLTQLMIQYNAVICLEDLNTGFMRGRQKVDKSVYQQFEQKLIKKMQYIVDKKAPADKPLGVLHGVQLAKEDLSLKGTQNGAIFYIPAWCTSKIDPVTGFVNLFNSRDLKWESVDRTRSFFSKFDSITYNKKKDYFEFSFDYSKFDGIPEDIKMNWTVCTFGDRIQTFRNPDKNNQWDNRRITLTEAFKKAFADAKIDLNGDLKQKIISLSDKKFLDPILYLFRLTVQMRNSITNSTAPEDDYLISPVCGSDGTFFDSRNHGIGSDLPCDADANGAYNIARKGLWLIQQIKESNPDKLPIMTKKDWLNFVQK